MTDIITELSGFLQDIDIIELVRETKKERNGMLGVDFFDDADGLALIDAKIDRSTAKARLPRRDHGFPFSCS